MSTINKEKEQVAETCSTGSCSTDKSKEQAQKLAEKAKVETAKLEQQTKKHSGSCCG